MRFPDLNVGWVFGYRSKVSDEGIVVTFLGGLVKIVFKYEDMEEVRVETYEGGRVSWDVLRWGRCPKGTKAIRVKLRRGAFRNHLIVFDDVEGAYAEIMARLRRRSLK